MCEFHSITFKPSSPKCVCFGKGLLHSLEKSVQFCWLAASSGSKLISLPLQHSNPLIETVSVHKTNSTVTDPVKNILVRKTPWLIYESWHSCESVFSFPVLLLLLWWISDSSSVFLTLHFYTLAFTATFVIQGKRFYFVLIYLGGNTEEVASSLVYIGGNF